MITSLPNILSLSRVGVTPVLVALFFFDGDLVRWATAALFTAAALTDYLDGYLARARDQQSSLGRFLDPVADKVLVAATLFMLVAVGRIAGWAVLPAVAILCREIVISGLREYLAGQRLTLPVTQLAKWKTGIQMAAIAILIVAEPGRAGDMLALAGDIGLGVAAVLSIATAYDYFRHSRGQMSARAASPGGSAKSPSPAG